MKFGTVVLILALTQCASSGNIAPEPTAATSVVEMMDSSIQIHVKIQATLILEDDEDKDNIVEMPVEDGWVGSGVVYDKSSGKLGPVHSRILSANHVLETPKVGSEKTIFLEFFGVQIPLGRLRIDSVQIVANNADGKVCNVEPLVLGSSDQHDVATAEIDCDIGRVAKIGSMAPSKGDKVTVVGYPLGVPLPVVTDGVVSGWLDGYLLTSAPAYGGNSGGAVFYNGEVIGLLVRGSRDYPHITLTTSLEEILTRIHETQQL